MKHSLQGKWLILIVLAAMWTIFTAIWAIYFVVIPQGSTHRYEAAKFIFLSISAFGVLFSSLLASFNSLGTTANLRERMEFDRVENAFDYISRWDAPPLKEARDWTRKIEAKKNKLSPDELCSRIEGVPPEQYASSDQRNLQRSVITMFNFFEELALSIQANRVAETYLRSAFASPYQSMYNRFLPWITRCLDEGQRGHLRSLSQCWTSESAARRP